MTALNGQLALSPLGAYINPNVTAALRGNDPAWIGWPTLQTDLGIAPAVQLARGTPAQPGYAINGAASRSYADDYYDRIHVIPNAINLGNLLTTQTRSVYVWNAWRDQALTLVALDQQSADGMTVTGPGDLPLTFTPLQMRAWSLTVSTDGPALIDAALTWLFADGQTASMQVTGQRLTAWLMVPEWSSGVTETLAWLTEVEQAWGGAQDRTPLRDTPRRTWEFDVTLGGKDRQIAESLLYAWRARAFALPVWPDQSFLGAALPAGSTALPLATAGLDFSVGESVLLSQSMTACELVEVSAVAANAVTLARPTLNAWPTGTQVYPCRVARLTDTAALARKSSDVLTASVKLESVSPADWAAIAPVNTYRGYPVLEDRSDEADDPEARYDRVIDTLDNDTGTPDTHDRTGMAWAGQSQAWVLAGRDRRATHRSLLYWLAGRANAVWLPSWADDLTLLQLVASNAVILTVRYCGVALYLAGRRHLRIELYDGTVFYRQVLAAADLGDGTEQVQVDASLGVPIDPAQVRQISWMTLSTLAGDSVEIHHDTDSMGIARCTTNFAGVPAEEPA